ncbi:MAG: thioredoxin domain-containing protein [Candidatus Aenigmarchaeota archaeon]|nr:thioredoxin domain-containing protein [Candidatus Aenigmarchaeota archaeon]
MSKRGRKHKREVASAEKANMPTDHSKTGGKDMVKKTLNVKILVTAIMTAVLFLGVGYFVGYSCNVTGNVVSMQSGNAPDELIFINPPGCSNCEKFEAVAKDVADTLGIPFLKTGFGQQVKNPGYVLVYNGVLTISGVNDEATFKTQICALTKNDKICEQAKKLKPSSSETTTEIPKKEKTNVKFFVMAYCPFGNQAESGLYPVYKLLKDKVDWEPHYVIYANYRGGGSDYCMENGKYCSMHGIQELHEDVRELCIWKYESHDKFWDFIDDVNTACNARNVDSCWEDVAKKHGIDVEKIKQCEQNEAVTLLEAEYQLNQKYGVRGSPTVLINDKAYRGSRTPQAYKTAICSGFENPPKECEQTLEGNSQGSAAGGCQ